MKFRLGRLVATPAVLAILKAAHQDVFVYVQRHQSGDWGDLGEEDKRANETAIACSLRILSAYKLGNYKIYVITEADRSSTCVLLADEY